MHTSAKCGFTNLILKVVSYLMEEGNYSFKKISNSTQNVIKIVIMLLNFAKTRVHKFLRNIVSIYRKRLNVKTIGKPYIVIKL